MNYTDKLGNINLYNGDCMEFMKDVPDKYYDLAVDKANRLDKMNLHLTACELYKEYYEQAKLRLYNHQRQLTIF